MARIDLSIPSLGNKFVDVRDTIPGDSFNWNWVRSLSGVNYLAIHHSAGPDTQTPEQIANYHIQNNGWGGIGYHFVIAKDGAVYYVGDIQTARANVANLNEQVIGICLIGNFTSGRLPSNEQLDSAHKLCEFFISSYPDLPNIDSWEGVRGHKELPGQSTACPGDGWSSWRLKIVEGVSPSAPSEGGIIFTPPQPPPDRGAQITATYRTVLGRDPDMGGLQTYTNGPMTIDEIMRSMVSSQEHQNLIRLGRETPALQDQLNNLQASLASLNQQVISLQQSVGEKDNQINMLKIGMSEQPVAVISTPPKIDTSLTIVGALINLYSFLFPPRKES